MFFAHDVADIDDPEKNYSLTPDDLMLFNPNTRTAPTFRKRRDAEITTGIYRRVPVLIREGVPDGNPWQVSSFSTNVPHVERFAVCSAPATNSKTTAGHSKATTSPATTTGIYPCTCWRWSTNMTTAGPRSRTGTFGM